MNPTQRLVAKLRAARDACQMLDKEPTQQDYDSFAASLSESEEMEWARLIRRLEHDQWDLGLLPPLIFHD